MSLWQQSQENIHISVSLSLSLCVPFRFADSELEELEAPPPYRPESLAALCRATRFTEPELKRIYRSFKAECPSGVMREDTFKVIYAQFFPNGESINQYIYRFDSPTDWLTDWTGLWPVVVLIYCSAANSGLYAHYVFNTLDRSRSGGIVNFEVGVEFQRPRAVHFNKTKSESEGAGRRCPTINRLCVNARCFRQDYVLCLSILARGTIEEKLRWTFSLYDINGDGIITREEMTDIVTAIYDLAGTSPQASLDHHHHHHQATGHGLAQLVHQQHSHGAAAPAAQWDESSVIKEKVDRIFQVIYFPVFPSLLFLLLLRGCVYVIWRRHEYSQIFGQQWQTQW